MRVTLLNRHDIGRTMAAQDKHQFQLWVLSLVEAQPFRGGRRGADGGVDGLIWFNLERGKAEKAVVSVKGGVHVGGGLI